VNDWIMVGIGLVLTVGTGLFVASEFALVNLDIVRLQQFVDLSPLSLGFVEAAPHCLSLHVMGPEVELHPERRVVGRLPRPPASRGEHVVVRALQTMVLAQDQVVEPTFSSIEEWLGNNTQD